jgi:hypothetical protein
VPVPRRSPTITRRAILRGLLGVTGAAGVSLTTGCSLFGDSSTPTPPAPNPLEGFFRDTVALADRYDAALAQVPALAGAITVARDTHRAHVKALAQALALAAPSAKPSGTAAPAGDGAAVLGALVQAETKARDAAVEACLNAPARLAILLGSIAAARATHLEVLR